LLDDTTPDWAAIARRYIETSDAVADICAEAGISEAELHRERRRRRWRRLNPRAIIPPRRRPSQPSIAGEAAGAPAGSPAIAPAASSPPTEGGAAAAPAPAAAARSRRTTPRKILIDRLVAAISLKLEQLERRMQSDLEKSADADPSAADHEKETRAIGVLIDNLGKLTEMEAGHARRQGPGGARAAGDLAGEADRHRRELQERLRRIVGAHARSP
jgi:hypothetical protein